MKEKPLVSIIVPVYNVEDYLEKCLDTLIGQTLKNIEIICVNDGSTDNCGEILNKYSQRDSRIIIVKQENQGLSSARNTGMRYVSGKYIMFVDSDDWIETETCETAFNTAKSFNADLVFWSYTREYGNSSKDKIMFWEDKAVFEEEQVKNQLQRRICGLLGDELAHPDYANALETAWGKLYLAERLLKNNIAFVDTKEIGTEDALFNLYALGYIKKAVYIKKCFNHYRKDNDTSLTKTYKQNLYAQWQHLFDLMQEYIDENNLPSDYQAALNNRIALSIVGLGLNIMSCDCSATKKIRMIKEIIKSERYKNAYKDLRFTYFPVHWKLFYGCAKYRCAFGVFILLRIIQKIISR